MKVLHIGKYYSSYIGGIEKVNYDLVETLNEAGVETDVFCFDHSDSTKEEHKLYKIKRTKVALTKFSTPISTTIVRDLKQLYKQYDIIHIHMPNPTAALAFQFLPFKGKIILHWHLDIVKQKIVKIGYKPFQTHLLKKADAIIVTSPEYLKHSKDLAPFIKKCHVIPIGIETDYLQENKEIENKLGSLYKNKKIIFSLGRLIYYKGFEYLIEAAKYLNDDYIILIGGSGILKNNLKKLISQNNLNDRVKLLGRIPDSDLASYYKKAAVFCLPSVERSEAFGIVLLEAMSFGCPLISTAMGSGTSWVNQHNSTGIVVPAKNPKALADAVVEITTNTAQATEFANNGKQRFKEEFELNKMTRRTLALYRNLIKDNQ